MTRRKSDRNVALSAFTAKDSDFLKSLGSRATHEPDSFHAAPKELLQSSSPTRYHEALRIAAFLGSFDPLKLIPNATEADLKFLLENCTVTTDGTTSRWSLLSDKRVSVISEVASNPNLLAESVANAQKYLERTNDPADDMSLSFQRILSSQQAEGFHFVKSSKNALAASRAVLQYLQPLDHALQLDVHSLLSEIDLAEMLEPFEFLTGFDPDTGRDTFVGRTRELRALRGFVDVLQSEGWFEAAARAGRRLTTGGPRMLCLYGVGGMGKSTLLAKFILQHLHGTEPSELSFVYLDFDRSTISALQPATLLLEMLRQLGWQLSAVHSDLDGMRQRIRQSFVDVARQSSSTGRLDIGSPQAYKEELPTELIGPSLMYTHFYELARIVGDRTILLILDTFEEAQAFGDDVVRRIETFLEPALQQLPGLKVLITGRDEVSGFLNEAERLELEEFTDKESRIEFLIKRGLTRQAAASVAAQIKGRPLTLHLAARLVKEQGLASVSIALKDRFLSLFNRYLIDGILYARILDHIQDKDLESVVHPGLVLRRIDREILETVIAPTAGLSLSPEVVDRIMASFGRQKDLVRLEADGSVTHRSDVREQMVVLMSLEKPELVRKLHQRAAEYYANRQAAQANAETRDRDRIEEIYHRLSIGDSLERMPDLWFGQARMGLGKSVDEITHVAGRGTLKALLGRVLTTEEANAIPVAVRREYAVKALDSAMNAHKPERALEILKEYETVIPAETRRLIEPRAMDRSGNWEAARRLFIELLRTGGSESSLSNHLAAADFYERDRASAELRGPMADDLLKVRKSWSGEFEGENRQLTVSLSALRLHVRRGRFRRTRIPYEEAGIIGGESELSAFSVPSDHARWLLTLTNELDINGPRIVESMQISNPMRDQLRYLRQLQPVDSARGALCVRICEDLIANETAGAAIYRLWKNPKMQGVAALVLRHILRPRTPQWYVPIACVLLRTKKPIRPSEFYDDRLPDLPFTAPISCSTSTSLADYLSHLDQLGVLKICLEKWLESRGGDLLQVREFVDAYREWLSTMLFDVDGWFDSFEAIRQVRGKHRPPMSEETRS